VHETARCQFQSGCSGSQSPRRGLLGSLDVHFRGMDVKVRSSGCPTRRWARPAELVGRPLRQRPRRRANSTVAAHRNVILSRTHEAPVPDHPRPAPLSRDVHQPLRAGVLAKRNPAGPRLGPSGHSGAHSPHGHRPLPASGPGAPRGSRSRKRSPPRAGRDRREGRGRFHPRYPQGTFLVIPVHLPGRDTSVNINLETRSANIATRRDGWRGAPVDLHKMPGQHNANIRVNSLFMRLWKWSADATVYLILFLTVSGIYLWIALRAERRIGLALIAAGAFSFAGIVYVVCRYSTPHRDPAQLVLEHFRALEPQAALLHRAVPALFCLALFAHRLAPEPLHVAIPAVLAEPEGLGGGAPHPGSGSRQRSPAGARAEVG